MKKFILPVLILTIIIQLFVPSYIVYEKYDTLRNGKEYKFYIELYDPYDAFRGRYVSFNLLNQRYVTWGTEGSYGHISLDTKGFAYIDSASETKPASGDYIKSISRRYFVMPNRYYTDEALAPEMQTLLSAENVKNLHPYVVIRVKNDNAVVQGLYIGKQRIEDYMKSAG